MKTRLNKPAAAITTEYNGVKITLNEGMEEWEAEINGRERTFKTLAGAKAAIDKPDKPPFKRFEAWVINYGRLYKVTVTSQARGMYSYYWTVSEDKKREQHPSYSIYPQNPHNDGIMNHLSELSKQIDALQSAYSELKGKLKSMDKNL